VDASLYYNINPRIRLQANVGNRSTVSAPVAPLATALSRQARLSICT
jgi:hypothetical protein